MWRLDRLGQSLKDLIRLVESLEAKGVGLRSLQEAIDTTSSGGCLVFHLFGALAEFERNLVRERRKQLDPEKRRLAVQLYTEKKHTVVEICRLMGISKPTLYSYVAEANG